MMSTKSRTRYSKHGELHELEELLHRFHRKATILLLEPVDLEPSRIARALRILQLSGSTLVTASTKTNTLDDIAPDLNSGTNLIVLRPKSLSSLLCHCRRHEHFDIAIVYYNGLKNHKEILCTTLQSLADHIILTGSMIHSDIDPGTFLKSGGWTQMAMGDSWFRVSCWFSSSVVYSRHEDITGRYIQVEANPYEKTYSSPNKSEKRQWWPGINLNTFLEFGGVFPSRSFLLRQLNDLHIPRFHGDLEPWNIILDGCSLSIIDFGDSRGLNDRKQIDIIAGDIHRVKGYAVYDLPQLQTEKLANSFLMILWSSAESAFGDIERDLSECYTLTFAGNFEFSPANWEVFLDALYANVRPDATAVAKREMLGRLPPVVRVLCYVLPGNEIEVPGPADGPLHVALGYVSNRYEEINYFKETMRSKYVGEVDHELVALGVGNDHLAQFAVVHAADSLSQSQHVLAEIAGAARRVREHSPIRYFGRYERFLRAHCIDPETVCIVDSATLAMLGLRPNRDLDFLVDETAEVYSRLRTGEIRTPPGLHWVQNWSLNREIPDRTLIYNGYLFSRHYGLKIGKLEPLYYNKVARDREKDKADVELIEQVQTIYGWNKDLFEFMSKGKPVRRNGRIVLRTMPDVLQSIDRAKVARRSLNPEELSDIPLEYWGMKGPSGEFVLSERLFPEGEETKRIWFNGSRGLCERTADFLRQTRAPTKAVDTFPSLLLTPSDLRSVDPLQVKEKLQRDVLLVLHFYRPGHSASNTLSYFVDKGYFAPTKILATVCGPGCTDFIMYCRKQFPGISLIEQDRVLASLRSNHLLSLAGVSLQDKRGAWIRGKGVTDWCSALGLLALGFEPKFIFFSDTDICLIERYDPAFCLGASLVLAERSNLTPCRVVPACSGRNNELVVAAIHNLLGQAKAAMATGNLDQAQRLADYHDILAPQVWPVAGEHILPFNLGGASPILDMPYPTGYGIEIFISLFLADCVRAGKLDNDVQLVQPQIEFPRIDQLNGPEKETGTLNLMAVFLGLVAEYKRRIADLGVEDMQFLNRGILPTIRWIHMIGPERNRKTALAFNAGQILPPPRRVFDENWHFEDVLEHCTFTA